MDWGRCFQWAEGLGGVGPGRQPRPSQAWGGSFPRPWEAPEPPHAPLPAHCPAPWHLPQALQPTVPLPAGRGARDTLLHSFLIHIHVQLPTLCMCYPHSRSDRWVNFFPYLLFLIFRKTTFTSCKMTSFLTSSTWASCFSMATGSEPSQRTCSVAWSTSTGFSSMITASVRWTAAPSAIWAAWRCFFSSTTPWPSCQARP